MKVNFLDTDIPRAAANQMQIAKFYLFFLIAKF